MRIPGLENLRRASMEAIAFQGGSKLASDLVELFQQCIDYRDAALKDNHGKAEKMTLEFYKNSIVKQMAEIIEKHTGLVVKSIYGSSTASMSFACMATLGEGRDGTLLTLNARSRYSGTGSVDGMWYEVEHKDRETGYSYYEYKVHVIDKSEEAIRRDLENIADLLDVKKAIIKSDGTNPYKGLGITYIFDFYTAFFSKEYFTNQVDYLTAAELAAIMLHETGHAISTIEYAGDMIRRHTRLLELTGVNDKTISNKDMLARLEALRTGIKKLPKTKETEDAEVILTNVTDGKVSIIAEFVASAILPLYVVASMIGTLIGALFSRMMLLVFDADFGDLFSDRQYRMDKLSDFATTKNSLQIEERYADEFVTRHGLSTALISALEKLNKMDEGSSILPIMRKSKLAFAATTAMARVSAVISGHSFSNSLYYEDPIKRAERALIDLTKIFKQEKLDDVTKDFYLAEIVRCEAEVRAVYEERGLTLKLSRWNTLFSSFTSIGGLIKMLSNGNMDRNYTELMNAIEAVSSNRMYIRSAQLDKLAR